MTELPPGKNRAWKLFALIVVRGEPERQPEEDRLCCPGVSADGVKGMGREVMARVTRTPGVLFLVTFHKERVSSSEVCFQN